ncbi:MAG TPA: sigma 54-interacting transcriptional regulator, partial [Gemmatimonadaceae bacterium]|nr:sigma 54-interacting transcriptional regulator [Gemmatimonadaceae bacterium]
MTAETPLPLVGTSVTMRALAARVGELERDVTRAVMLIGPRGVGKRYIAQRIHRASVLATAPLLVIDARRDDEEHLRTTLQRAPVGSELLVRHVELLPTSAQALLDHHVAERGALSRLMATTTSDIVTRVTEGS